MAAEEIMGNALLAGVARQPEALFVFATPGM